MFSYLHTTRKVKYICIIPLMSMNFTANCMEIWSFQDSINQSVGQGESLVWLWRKNGRLDVTRTPIRFCFMVSILESFSLAKVLVKNTFWVDSGTRRKMRSLLKFLIIPLGLCMSIHVSLFCIRCASQFHPHTNASFGGGWLPNDKIVTWITVGWT